MNETIFRLIRLWFSHWLPLFKYGLTYAYVFYFENKIYFYIILKELYAMGTIGWKPALVLSKLATEKTESEPHVFVMLNKDNDISSVKHVLFDVEKDEFYTLDALDFRGAYGYDYIVLSVEEYGVVISERQFYPKEYAAKFGLLTFEDGKLGMDEFEKDSLCRLFIIHSVSLAKYRN